MTSVRFVEEFSSGYPTLWFIEVSEELICGLCLEVLKNPYQCQNGHLYCKTCFLRSLSYRKVCPTCDVKVSRQYLARCLYAKKVIDLLPTLCLAVDSDSACEWIGQLHQRERHCTRECDYRVITCGNGCKEFILAKNRHKHETEQCVRRNRKCSYCETLCSFDNLLTHMHSCPQLPIKCICQQIVPQMFMREHKLVCQTIRKQNDTEDEQCEKAKDKAFRKRLKKLQEEETEKQSHK